MKIKTIFAKKSWWCFGYFSATIGRNWAIFSRNFWHATWNSSYKIGTYITCTIRSSKLYIVYFLSKWPFSPTNHGKIVFLKMISFLSFAFVRQIQKLCLYYHGGWSFRRQNFQAKLELSSSIVRLTPRMWTTSWTPTQTWAASSTRRCRHNRWTRRRRQTSGRAPRSRGLRRISGTYSIKLFFHNWLLKITQKYLT